MRGYCHHVCVLIGTVLLGSMAWEAAPAAKAANPPFFNVMDYGAHNRDTTPSTDAFRAAIQAAKQAGGGTVFVPAGKYVSGPIELISNLTLYIDAGAMIDFPATMRTWPLSVAES